ncbi:MAG: coproporphyrinogen dehydrogenase HemZ [Clostridia bacterium]|nr:coproporphyrinogen dehydrogenase HemZ [Clostridia bacterium]
MILRIIDHKFHYEAENLCRVFYPHEKIAVVKDFEGEDKLTVVTALKVNGTSAEITVSFNSDGEEFHDEATVNSSVADKAFYDTCEKKMMTMLFGILSSATGYVPQWGILTGVRPSKLMTSLVAEMGDEKAKRYFTDELLVKKDKTQLAYSVSKAEEKIISLSQKQSFSLYISIPFCPTRCNYCSFVSHSVEQAKKLIPEYVDNLCKELEYTAEYARKLNLRLESVYWGGGTPTTLSAEQLARVCSVISQNFDLSYLREYTVEAGRPDTVTKEKLIALKMAGVSRISINPQTFNDSVLHVIGRKHTSAQTLEAFAAARDAGFDNINMDLIAGLTTDTFPSFCKTLDTAVSLNPENITLHTLALKRSSRIVTGKIDVESGELANKMLRRAERQFTQNGYEPYYMYRQSRSLGNLENVGWCKEGYECLYNIFMMEECHTVLAAGAGAVTKLKQYGVNNIERIFNFKFPYEYNTRFDEILARKENILRFYELYGG